MLVKNKKHNWPYFWQKGSSVIFLTLNFFKILCFLYARCKTGRIMLWRCPSVRGHFSFPDFFLPSLQLLHWNLVYCFLVKSYNSSSRFSMIDSFLQELYPWNLEEFKNFSVFQTFFCHLCIYKIETWFIAL
jgi:hypothetical protein